MKIEVTSPSPQVAEAVRQHLGLSTHTYELWFLGDMVGEPLPKNRDNLNALLKEAHQMLTDAAAVGGVVGEAMVAIVLANSVLEKFGGDHIDETLLNFTNYLSTIGPSNI